MQLSFMTAWIVQLLFNLTIILTLLYIGFLIVSLVHRVRKDKKEKVNKKKEINKIVRYTVVALILFFLINFFFEFDPLNIIEDPLGDTIQDVME